MVGGNVLRQTLGGRGVRRSRYRDAPEIVVGGSGLILVVIRGVANLPPVRREGIVVLPAEREYGRIIVVGGQVNGRRQRLVLHDASFFRHTFKILAGRDHENVAAVGFFVGIPMTI